MTTENGEKFSMINHVAAADAEACLRIYAPFVAQTDVSLETVVPTVAEFAKRISDISSFYPFLTWKEKGEVLGFVYARRYRERAAYDWICESGIYLDERSRGKGIGKQLYLKLFECLHAMNMVSVIGVTRSDSASAKFHRHLGFKSVGLIPLAGYKLEHWCDLEFLQYELISPPPVIPQPVIPFPEVSHVVSLTE